MMFGRRAARTTRRSHWRLLAGVLLLLYATQALQAQDEMATDEPTPTVLVEEVAAEPVQPTVEVALPEAEQPLANQPIEPSPQVPVVLPTEVPPILALPVVTLAPTEIPPTSMVVSTDVLPAQTITEIGGSPAVEPLPTESVVVPGLPAEATVWPTAPVTTLTPPTPTALAAIVPNMQLIAGEAHSVLLVGNALGSVASLALHCQADPALLQGVSASATGLFMVAGTLHDIGFQPDGQWLLVWSRTLAEADSPTPSVLMRLDFQPLAAGVTSLVCQVYAGDAFGQPLLDAPLSITLIPEPMTPIEVEATAEPTVGETTFPAAEATEPEPTPERLIITPDVVEFTPEATIETTGELAPERIVVTPEVADTMPMSDVEGQIISLIPLADVQMRWEGAAMQQSVTPAADGSFSVRLLAGTYRLTVTAPRHLPYSAEVEVKAGTVSLPPIMLNNGDIDGSGQIDSGDVDLLVANYGQPVPQALASADLNNDGLIDLYDLAILGANLSS